jgi:hypothetical protein
MSGQIAIFEGHLMPRKRKKPYRGFGAKRGGEREHSRFRRAAKLCSRLSKRGKVKFRDCMAKHLRKKKKGR